MKYLLLLLIFSASITINAGDYTVLMQNIGHGSDDNAIWTATILPSFAGEEVTQVPEEVYEDVDGSFITNAAHSVTNWILLNPDESRAAYPNIRTKFQWTGGTTTNDVQITKDSRHYKILSESNSNEREVQPDGSVTSTYGLLGVTDKGKSSDAKLNGIFTGQNPNRIGINIEDNEVWAGLTAAGFLITEPTPSP
jgi:hypothetical protein